MRRPAPAAKPVAFPTRIQPVSGAAHLPSNCPTVLSHLELPAAPLGDPDRPGHGTPGVVPHARLGAELPDELYLAGVPDLALGAQPVPGLAGHPVREDVAALRRAHGLRAYGLEDGPAPAIHPDE